MIHKIESVECRVNGNEFVAELQYPRNNPIQYVEVALCDVRSADGVRVSYDFDRDGWKVEQARYFEWGCDDTVCDPGWVEVAFVQAWGSKVEGGK